MFTGATPHQHGLWDFVTFDRSKGASRLASPGDLPRVLTIWEVLSRRGATVGLYNVPWTYTYPGIDGYVIPGYGALDLTEKQCRPPEILSEIVELFGDYPISPMDEWAKLDPPEIEEIIARRLRQKADIAIHLLTNHPADVFVFGIMEVDHAGHTIGFWPPSMDDPEVIANSPIGKAYRVCDEAVGAVVDALPEPIPVVLLSDHGQTAPSKTIDVVRLLQDMGAFKLKSGYGLSADAYFRLAKFVWPVLKLLRMNARKRLPSRLRSVEEGLRPVLDWDKTKAIPWGSGGGGAVQITLNPGLDRREREELVVQIRRALADAGAEGFEEIHPDPEDTTAPDILASTSVPGVNFRTAAGAKGDIKGLHVRNGIHMRTGVIVLNELARKQEAWTSVSSLAHVAGAVAQTVLGIDDYTPVPRDADGATRQDYSAEEEELVEERLRNLGYI